MKVLIIIILYLHLCLYSLDAETIRTVSTDVTTTSDDEKLKVDASGGNRIITLVRCTSSNRVHQDIKKIDSTTNTVTIDPYGTQTIDESTSYVLTKQRNNIGIKCDGSNWIVLYGSGETITGSISGSFLQKVQEEGSDLTASSTLNFIGSGITCVYNAGVIDCTVSAGSSFFQTVQDESSDLTQRAKLNFLGAGITCVDDGVDSIDCTISGAGGSNHDLLSATHNDTVAASPVLGDLLYSNSTPAWTKLAGNTSTTKKFLSQTGNGTISAVPVWDDINFTNLVGTATDAQTPDTHTHTDGTIPLDDITPASDDQTIISNGSIFQAKTLPDCANATTSKLLYDQSTNAYSCGTDQGGSSSPTHSGNSIGFWGPPVFTGNIATGQVIGANNETRCVRREIDAPYTISNASFGIVTASANADCGVCLYNSTASTLLASGTATCNANGVKTVTFTPITVEGSYWFCWTSDVAGVTWYNAVIEIEMINLANVGAGSWFAAQGSSSTNGACPSSLTLTDLGTADRAAALVWWGN